MDGTRVEVGTLVWRLLYEDARVGGSWAKGQ